MKYLNKRFGIEKIELTLEEESLLNESLIVHNQTKIDYVSYFCILSFFVMLILDFYYFNKAFQQTYLLFDTILFSLSVLVFIISSFVKGNKNDAIHRFKNYIYTVYPMFIILWATSIATFDQNSLLNVMAFYFALFVVLFILEISIFRIVVYVALSLTVYTFLSLVLNTSIFSETMAMLILGYASIIPFALHAKKTRYNAVGQKIKIQTMNLGLESMVEQRTIELQNLNTNLEQEITYRKNGELKLRDALEKAEQNDKLKSEFLANISHEIRTPLNAIVGFTELITEESTPPQQKKIFQQQVESNTFYLLSTVDDIFDVSLIKSNQLNPICKIFSVNDFLDNLVYEIPSFQSKHNNGNIQFKLSKLNSDQVKINTDDYFLKKALLRLLDNAYKFTSEGEIEAGAKLNNKHIEFYVNDTGIGIDKKDHKKIFEPFVQADGSYTRGFGGSGLGLSIVRGICESLQCQLNFTSRISEGTKFTLRFDKFFIVE